MELYLISIFGISIGNIQIVATAKNKKELVSLLCDDYTFRHHMSIGYGEKFILEEMKKKIGWEDLMAIVKSDMVAVMVREMVEKVVDPKMELFGSFINVDRDYFGGSRRIIKNMSFYTIER